MKTFLPKDAAEIKGARWFGLDLAKRESQLAVLDPKGEQIVQKRFQTTRDNILLLASELKRLREENRQLRMERESIPYPL